MCLSCVSTLILHNESELYNITFSEFRFSLAANHNNHDFKKVFTYVLHMLSSACTTTSIQTIYSRYSDE